MKSLDLSNSMANENITRAFNGNGFEAVRWTNRSALVSSEQGRPSKSRRSKTERQFAAWVDANESAVFEAVRANESRITRRSR